MSLARMTIRRMKKLIAWALAIILLLLLAAGFAYVATSLGWV